MAFTAERLRFSHKPKEGDAFANEYTPRVSRGSLYDDIITFLGEYDWQRQKTPYELDLTVDDAGVLRMSYRKDGETMVEKTRRGIDKKRRQGRDTRREEADLAGALRLDDQLARASIGDRIVWGSPPTAGSAEYGEYGYIYMGRVEGTDESRTISLEGVRIEDRTLENYNRALSELLGQEVRYARPEDFIANPVVVPEFSVTDPDSIFKSVFEFVPDPREKQKIAAVLHLLDPAIEGFIDKVKAGASPEEFRASFNALRLHAIAEWENVQKLFDAFPGPVHVVFAQRQGLAEVEARYQGQKAPQRRGSCGGTDEEETDPFGTTNIMDKYSGLSFLETKLDFLEDDGGYDCPNCKKRYPNETDLPPEKRTKVCEGTKNGEKCGFKFGC